MFNEKDTEKVISYFTKIKQKTETKKRKKNIINNKTAKETREHTKINYLRQSRKKEVKRV